MFPRILKFALGHWMWLAGLAAVAVIAGWIYAKGISTGTEWLNNRIERQVIEMLEQREKVDAEVDRASGDDVRRRLLEWVPEPPIPPTRPAVDNN